jgi:hypothetical protein
LLGALSQAFILVRSGVVVLPGGQESLPCLHAEVRAALELADSVEISLHSLLPADPLTSHLLLPL